MMLYPDVQKKAQDEINYVVGSDRLPVIMDRERLPYVNAIIKELLRWSTPVPFGEIYYSVECWPLAYLLQGLPHVASTDDTYNGYHIPKGAAIIPNIW